ncbi:MAG: hypothetical protein COV46_04910 [Deltaproteobacteria bacterium CG11_big_fil_rev_8_21_14_0_20_49_13]|nr:MAG: hypothetical protein COV46_04910 [Deltaproteobacteria bacterium CG11_big_fil_rev_8_21_14_0_20_49_13]
MSSAEDIFDREENEGRAVEHLGRVMADPYAEFSEVEGLGRRRSPKGRVFYKSCVETLAHCINAPSSVEKNSD